MFVLMLWAAAFWDDAFASIVLGPCKLTSANGSAYGQAAPSVQPCPLAVGMQLGYVEAAEVRARRGGREALRMAATLQLQSRASIPRGFPLLASPRHERVSLLIIFASEGSS